MIGRGSVLCKVVLGLECEVRVDVLGVEVLVACFGMLALFDQRDYSPFFVGLLWFGFHVRTSLWFCFHLLCIGFWIRGP